MYSNWWFCVWYFLAIRTLVRKLYIKLNYSNVLVLVLVLVVLGLVLVLEIFFWSRSRSRSRHNLVSLTSLVIFHPFATKPPMGGSARNLAQGSSRGRKHLFQTFSRSVQETQICEGSNFAIFRWLSLSPNTGRCYRALVVIRTSPSSEKSKVYIRCRWCAVCHLSW